MVDLPTRAYEAADAPALAAMFNEIEKHGGGHPGYTPDELDNYLNTVLRDVTTDSRLVFAPDGALVAAALTCPPPEGGFRADVMGGVLPQWRGRGIGRDLLAWQLARATDINNAVAPDARWEIHAFATMGDDDPPRLFRRFGMTPLRYWFEMVASTADAPELELPAGLWVLPYAVTFDKELHAAHMDAFSDHWGYQYRSFAVWSSLTIHSDGFLPELSVLALDGDELAGYVLSYKDADPAR
ncbi:MAG TPA: GNAT family N-acetyltransferase, partial [Micromonosporaceae bacterium]|nr:GNAT family N-acetyltransferase [Micromonosporaceae bacterium]